MHYLIFEYIREEGEEGITEVVALISTNYIMIPHTGRGHLSNRFDPIIFGTHSSTLVLIVAFHLSKVKFRITT